MNFKNEVYNAVNTYIDGAKALDDQARQLESQWKEERITGKVFNEKKLEIERYRAAHHAEAVAHILDIEQRHSAAVDRWDSPSGDKLTDDAKLLQMDFPLSPVQFQELIDRHRDNSTMLTLLRDFAERHKDSDLYADVPPSAAARKTAFHDFSVRAIATLDNPDSLSAAFFLDGNGVPGIVGVEYAE